MAGGEGVSGDDRPDAHRILEVHPDACREVIDAAFSALREKLIREDPPDAARRLARLNAAHRALSDPSQGDARDTRPA
jgi:hypothetical protein